MLRSIIPACLLICLSVSAAEWEHLLDKEFSHFEIWMGVPHSTVQGLPEGTYQSDNVHAGTPMGLNADVKQVFKMVEEDGELLLHISGEIYGGLTTLKEYANYHMSVQMKWGDKKWQPRLNALRDNGILYHCHDAHAAFWKVWKASLEFQVQETDMGDFIQLAGPAAKVSCADVEGSKRRRFNPDGEYYHGGYISAWPEPDAPHGEWNQLDLYVLGNNSVHVVNSEVVMVVEHARRKDGSRLNRGQIQIQSEAAEAFYKDLKIRPITAFPEQILKRVRFRSE